MTGASEKVRKALDLYGLSESELGSEIHLDNELGLEIHLDNKDGFIGYASVTLVKDGKRHEFTPEQFIEGMERMAHTAKRINVPRKDYAQIGHHECSECGATIGYNNLYCHRCGARFEE